MSETVIIRNTRTVGARYVPNCCTASGAGGGLLSPGEQMSVLQSKLRSLLGDGIVELDDDGSPVDIVGMKALARAQAKTAMRESKSTNAHK